MNWLLKLLFVLGSLAAFWFVFLSPIILPPSDEALDNKHNRSYLAKPGIKAYVDFLKKVESIQSLSEIEDYISPYYRERFLRKFKTANDPVTELRDTHTLSKIKFTSLHYNKPNDIKFSFVANSKTYPANSESRRYKSRRDMICDVRMTSKNEQWYLQFQYCIPLPDDDYTGMTEPEIMEKKDRDYRKHNLKLDQ